MHPIAAIMRRELRSYFVTPVAYVFLMIFLVLASGAVGIFIYGFAMPIEVIKLH